MNPGELLLVPASEQMIQVSVDFREPAGPGQSEVPSQGLQRYLVHALAFPLGCFLQLGGELGIQPTQCDALQSVREECLLEVP